MLEAPVTSMLGCSACSTHGRGRSTATQILKLHGNRNGKEQIGRKLQWEANLPLIGLPVYTPILDRFGRPSLKPMAINETCQ